MPLVIGPDVSSLRPGEEDEVEALLRAAFPGPEEAGLVRRLRADGVMQSERVLRWQGRIGAYVAMSRMIFPKGWLALAPVAVLPAWQGGVLGRDQPDMQDHYRFGSRIVRHTASEFIEFGHRLREELQPKDRKPTLVVLGKPSFYARCGFSLERAARLTSPYPIANTLIARAGDDVPEEALVYPPAFDLV
jgi:putative acetyltransferase